MTTVPMRPASPALTNPDMILPYGQDEYNTTPSALEQSLVQRGAWAGKDVEFSIGSNGQIMGSVMPTTPIIYGNGTMLSDIGEVTEAESTSTKPLRPSNARSVRTQSTPLSSSPTMGFDAVLKRSKFGSHQRTVSAESTSTVTTEGQVAEMHFEDFDDGVSIDDSNFQGDDEDSVAEGYEHESFVEEGGLATRERAKTINVDHNTQNKDLLSRRAELILANAKKRLDSMEGNLTRARSSLYITPSTSISSINGSSPLHGMTPSPPEGRGRILPQLGMPPARHRQMGGNGLPSPTSPGHTRIFSENSIPSSLHSASYDSNPIGTEGRDTNKLLLPHIRGDSETKGVSRSLSRSYQSSPLLYTPNSRTSDVEELREDAITPDFQTNLSRIRPSTAEPYRHILGDSRGLTRSASSMQMRDLTGKMRDLRGKISTLRDKAREDNLKRRSLQSLRTPSPFTAAEPWYAAANSPNLQATLDASTVHNPWNGEPSVSGEKTDGNGGQSGSTLSGGLQSGTPESHRVADADELRHVAKPSTPRHHPTITEDDEHYETAEELEPITEDDVDVDDYTDELINREELQDYRSESEASQYHDSLATQISHEDREDAFDYEHFFLHSAIGTISPQNMHRRDSTASYSSEGSVETIHGPADPPSAVYEKDFDDRTAKGHSRQKSADSVSTFATFATAAEGFTEEDAEEDTEEDTEEDENRINHESHVDVVASQPEFKFPAKESSPELRPATPEKSSRRRSALVMDTQQVDNATQTTPERIISRSSSIRQTGERPYSRGNISNPDRVYSRPSSVLRNGEIQRNGVHHRPSVSSVSSSAGSTRAFPLVNKPKTSPVTATPASPVQAKEATKETVKELTVELKEDEPADFPSNVPQESPLPPPPPPTSTITVPSLMAAPTLTEKLGLEGVEKSPIRMLLPEDQVLVERLVASLGKCLLGLQECSPGVDGTMWRGRLDTARRVLEGEALRSAVSIEELRSRRTTGLAARTSRGIEH